MKYTSKIYKEVVDQEGLNDLLFWLKQRDTEYLYLDTETNGLNIITSKPFMIQVGFGIGDEMRVYYWRTEDVQLEDLIKILDTVRNTSGMIWAHNVKFDMHMLYNIGVPVENYLWGDTQVLARLGTYVDTKGSMGLKPLYSYYLRGDISASKQIDDAMKKLRADHRKKIQLALSDLTMPNGRPWTLKGVEDYLNPKKFDYDINSLDEATKSQLELILILYPEPTYEDIDYELMKKYGAEDIVMGLELCAHFIPIVNQRSQGAVASREWDLILPLWRIERKGIPTDLNYLNESANDLKKIILEKRKVIRQISGDPEITPSSDKRIKEALVKLWEIEVKCTDKAMLKEIANHEIIREKFPEAIEFVETITLLRTLEKWYSTYAIKVGNNVVHGNLHTMFNQASTVSGRFSSDVHQFPKGAIKVDGEEIFSPRKAFTVPKGMSAVFLDFSQIELRCQADYTLDMGGDINLCRAYMPYLGKSFITGEMYSINNPEHIDRWNSGEWLIDGEPWTPTDLHSLTTQNAFPNLDPDSAEFKEKRKYGKTTNFAKNYGGGRNAVVSAVPSGTSDEIIDALNNSYGITYPMVQKFGNEVMQTIEEDGYIENKFGRRYYFKYDDELYKAANYVVQGSCADMLKECIIKIDRYILKNNLKSYMFSHVHDEIQFMFHNDEMHHVQPILDIMQTFPDEFRTPIVSDPEISNTNWAEKRDLEL